MGTVVGLKNANPLVGTWGSLDEDGTTVEYKVTSTANGFAVEARDTYDGELGRVLDIEKSGSALSFTVAWSTGRVCKCTMKPATDNQVQFTFTYTEHEHLQRRAT